MLLVTHDIGEAIALSDRIALLSARPGTLVEVLDVPQRRSRDVFRRERGNDDLYAHIWDHLAAQATETWGDLMRSGSPIAPARWKVARRSGRRSSLAISLVWEFAPNWVLEELLWSRPSAIFAQTVVWLADGTLLRSALATLGTVAAGMLIGGARRHRGRSLMPAPRARSRG